MKLQAPVGGLIGPTKEHEERLLAFLTDCAAYMLKAAGALQVFYPKMIHITCIVHGLHRAAEEIHASFTESRSCACINLAILAADDVGIQSELLYIGAHTKTLPETMIKLEESGLQLTTAVSLLNTVTTSFNKLPASLGRILTEKMKKTEEFYKVSPRLFRITHLKK
ncbi:hypothetical protein ANN_06446 [Periplaneta americana]|uniref:DUF659 domain-containing protein n=1 Tax=Periplaneta americana TaxID=6978 RepID=A0ABQ8TFM3_PERAM|nr:hypothetical protein ANN_06446 [Periplaneta americana]